MPLNERMMELVVTKADLLETPTMPDCLLRLAAHVAAYRAFIAQWDEGNFSQHKSIINFPPDLLDYATHTFAKLKEEQQGLLGPQRSERSLPAFRRMPEGVRPPTTTTSTQRLD